MPALIVAIFLNLNYISLASMRPHDISANKAYQCEWGQNWTNVIVEVILLATLSLNVWNIDSLLSIF